MFATQGLLAAALAVVGFAAWRLLRDRKLSSAQSIGIVAAAMWFTASAVVGWRHEPPSGESLGRSQLVQSLESLAWPEPARVVAPAFAPGAAPAAGVQAASVESLVGGLEARLAARPDDAEGWALLAQSYAYTANEEATERAVRRAVALGVDEQSLRERVAKAERSAPQIDWVDRAIGARRQ